MRKSNFTVQELMNLADTMYKARVQMNKWALISTEQEEIVALNAKITQLEQSHLIYKRFWTTMLFHLWELLILLKCDYGAMVMAAIQVSLIIIVISFKDPKETHDMPYVPKRK